MMFYRMLAVMMMTAFFFGGCFMLPEEEGDLVPPVVAPEEIPFRTIVLERQDLVDAVSVRGAIAPALMENHLFGEKGGRVSHIHVRVGDEVEKGQVMVELAVDGLDETIEYQRLTVDRLKADLVQTGALQALQIKKVALILNRQQKELSVMEENPALFSAKEIQEARDNLALEELNYQIEKMNKDQILKNKENALAIEELRLKNQERSLEKSLIRSAIPGVVTYIKRMFIGDAISDFDTIVSVADPNRIQVAYEGSMAHEFQLGMEVALEYRGKGYTGTVTLTPDSVPPEEKPLYINKAVFEFAEVPETFIMGDDVNVKGLLDERKDVIVLPKEAIKTFGSDQLVYVLEEGEKRERYVQVGIDAGPYIEVTEGLEEGDELIVN